MLRWRAYLDRYGLDHHSRSDGSVAVGKGDGRGCAYAAKGSERVRCRYLERACCQDWRYCVALRNVCSLHHFTDIQSQQLLHSTTSLSPRLATNLIKRRQNVVLVLMPQTSRESCWSCACCPRHFLYIFILAHAPCARRLIPWLHINARATLAGT